MKFAVLSLAATAALALSAGDASAQWGHFGHHHGHSHGYGLGGGHLDYHNGHLHYHNGFYRSGPLYPAYNYGYSSPYSYGYGSGYGGNLYSPYSSGYGSFYTPRSYYGYGLRW
jgi:hypothetical protein